MYTEELFSLRLYLVPRYSKIEKFATNLNGNVHQRHEHESAPYFRHQRLTIFHFCFSIIAALKVLEEALVSDGRLERKHRPKHAVTV
jgi:hypothetical protein